MTIRASLAVGALLLGATPATAGSPFDVHSLIVGNEGARYVKGIPTIDLQQQRGAVQLRSLGFYDNKPIFAVALYNAGLEPVNVGIENVHANVNGAPLRVFPVAELERQAKHKAWWTQFGMAMLGGLSAGLASSQRYHYHSTLSGPYGTYRVNGSYPSLAGALEAGRIQADTTYGIAAIQYQLDQTIGMINDNVIQTTTVDPAATYGGLVVLDKIKAGSPPYEVHVDIDWNGERYPFAFLILKRGAAVPNQYAAMLAENAKPRVMNAAFLAAVAKGAASGQASPAAARKIDGAIYLQSGVVKVPAKTASGYCLRVPYGYMGTGAIGYPAITSALPVCKEATE